MPSASDGCSARPWRETGDGLELQVRVTPRARREGVEGVVRDAAKRTLLAVRVAALPAGGRANAAVAALLADLLDVPKSRVRLAAGASGRTKRFVIEGDARDLAARLEAALARLGRG